MDYSNKIGVVMKTTGKLYLYQSNKETNCATKLRKFVNIDIKEIKCSSEYMASILLACREVDYLH
jgi:hypothetical protein